MRVEPAGGLLVGRAGGRGQGITGAGNVRQIRAQALGALIDIRHSGSQVCAEVVGGDICRNRRWGRQAALGVAGYVVGELAG